MCPQHGHYHPDPEAAALVRRATSPWVPPATARGLLDQAALIRRWCPTCNGLRPTPLEWAVAIRSLPPPCCAIPAGFGHDPDCPQANPWG